MNSRNMKIAMLSIHSCPIGDLGTKDTGGMSVYIRGLAKELGKKGCRVDIYTRRHDNLHPDVMALSENVRLIHLKVDNDEHLCKLALYPLTADYAAALDAYKTDQKVVYDLIHSHYWLSGLVGERLHTLWRVPHVVMFHTLGAIKNTLGIGEHEPDYRISSEKNIAHSCQKIVAPTCREKEDIIHYYDADPQFVEVIPCGVDQELFKPVDRKTARSKIGFSLDEKILLYVGRVEPLKGLERIISALDHLMKNRMAVKFLIVGGDDPDHVEMQHLKRMIRNRALEAQVVFSGRVDQKELPFYYSAADALVVASYYESFGLVALEALSCGTPVVSTAVGGMPSIIEKNITGMLVQGDAPETMGEAIFKVLSDSTRYQKQRFQIRKAVEPYSWVEVALRTERLYRSIQNREE